MVNSLPIPVPVCSTCYSTDISVSSTHWVDGEESRKDQHGLAGSQKGYCAKCDRFRKYEYMTPYEARKKIIQEGT